MIINCIFFFNSFIDKIFSCIGCGYYIIDRGFAKDVIDMTVKLVFITRRYVDYIFCEFFVCDVVIIFDIVEDFVDGRVGGKGIVNDYKLFF